MKRGFERALAEWAATSDAFTDRARARAQDALVDVTACIISGAHESSTQAVAKVARQAGSGRAFAIGADLRLPACWAALVRGTAAHALDFDDNFAPAVTHATAVLAPALFALADEEGCSGAEVIDAYIVGLEVQARIGERVNPVHYEKGWHATSTVGTLGAAAACARLLELDESGVLAAMSIAFSMAAGSKKQFGSMMKPIHAGLAAKNAVLAARMAQAGITGDTQPLEGQWGFAELYGVADQATSSEANVPSERCDILAIESSGLLEKRFPCCGAAHRTLDGLVELRERHHLELHQVNVVEAFVPAFARANLKFDDPQNADEARFSLTYCAARVLQGGRLTLNDMTAERVRDPSLRPWLSRMRIFVKAGTVSEELGEKATPAITRVITQQGVVLETGVAIARGAPQLPLTLEERREKFRDCCHWAGRLDEADRLFELARSLHELKHLAGLSQALASIEA